MKSLRNKYTKTFRIFTTMMLSYTQLLPINNHWHFSIKENKADRKEKLYLHG